MINHPNFYYESKLWRLGYRFVVGLDEVGRGPLAGPVVAGAVCVVFNSVIANPALSKNIQKGRGEAIPWNTAIGTTTATVRDCLPTGDLPKGRPVVRPAAAGLAPRNDIAIRDSKKLTSGQREEWYKILTNHSDIKWGIGVVSEKIIDKINIFEATKLAMEKAVKSLNVEPDYLLLDGNFTLESISINQKAIIRGDEKIFSCAAASIIAKVTRDQIMTRSAKKYPQYCFEKHKGYGTRQHFLALKKHGPCKMHRFSFAPLKNRSLLSR